jgi:hypothetical protein
MALSQGYPVEAGYPSYVATVFKSKLVFSRLSANGEAIYYCPTGSWELTAKYDTDRKLVISTKSHWQLQRSVGSYITPLTTEQYNEPDRIPKTNRDALQ